MSVNQAVLFTKPVHHLGLDLTPEHLDELARTFFESKGFNFIFKRTLTGSDLAARGVIRQHYLMYSKAACADSIAITNDAEKRFEAAFGHTWDSEFTAGKIMPTAELLKTRLLSVHQLFNRWNGLFGAGKTTKLQDGIIMGYLEDLDAYCINAFYPSMEANFYHPDTRISYYVVEFDPQQTSWKQFRKEVLGSTNSSNALPESFRGQLYSEYTTAFPGRDNFVHGSAGPFEGFVERAIHEEDFDMRTNPVGQFLAEKGLNLDIFNDWKSRQTITELGRIFDETEEKNTDEIFQTLGKIQW